MDRFSHKVIIISKNLDGFSLVNHGRFAKFAKLSRYTVIRRINDNNDHSMWMLRHNAGGEWKLHSHLEWPYFTPISMVIPSVHNITNKCVVLLRIDILYCNVLLQLLDIHSVWIISHHSEIDHRTAVSTNHSLVAQMMLPNK